MLGLCRHREYRVGVGHCGPQAHEACPAADPRLRHCRSRLQRRLPNQRLRVRHASWWPGEGELLPIHCRDRCKENPDLLVAKISNYTWATTTKNETQLQAALYHLAPLSVCIDATTWQTYTSGILTKNCGRDIDCCAQLTGWGVEDSTPYWSIRNGWGEAWGEQGYIRIGMGDNICGIADMATTAIAA